MIVSDHTGNTLFVILRPKWVLRLILFLASLVLTFVLKRETSLLSLVMKSLFIFVPSLLILMSIEGIRPSLQAYEKHGWRDELFSVVVLALSIAFYLLLIGLFIKTLLTKP
jgi:Mn2+/Fe2+ NRAMP family transporter